MAFESITDEKITELLLMPKKVVNPGARSKTDNGCERYNYKVRTIGEIEYEMILYARQNLRPGMEDDFSCGLSLVALDGEILTLTRYNGSSHPHTNHLENQALDKDCHIHKATERYIRAGRKPEGFAETTHRYHTRKGALHCLVSDNNISGIHTEADEPLLAGL